MNKEYSKLNTTIGLYDKFSILGGSVLSWGFTNISLFSVNQNRLFYRLRAPFQAVKQCRVCVMWWKVWLSASLNKKYSGNQDQDMGRQTWAFFCLGQMPWHLTVHVLLYSDKRKEFKKQFSFLYSESSIFPQVPHKNLERTISFSSQHQRHTF